MSAAYLLLPTVLHYMDPVWKKQKPVKVSNNQLLT